MEKIRTAHIIDKKTKKVVAKVNYIGGDDHDSLLEDAIKMIFTRVYPANPFLTDINFFHRQLNYAFKHRYTCFGRYPEGIISNEINTRILNLFGYPFDSKKLKLYPIGTEVGFAQLMGAMDFPTGTIPLLSLACYGEKTWVKLK